MPIVPNYPMVNKGELYATKCRLAAGATATTLLISDGQMRDSTNINDIVVPATVTINAAVQGANGIDQGALAATTFYAVYVIGSSTNGDSTSADYVPSAGLISANLTTPALPTDYDMYRRVGYVLTDGAALILAFQQQGTGVQRVMWYDDPIQVLNNGVSAAYVAVDCSPAIPNLVDEGALIFDLQYTPTAAGNLCNLKTTSNASASGNVIVSGAVAAVVQELQVTCPCGILATTAVSYKAVGSLDLFVTGYYDDLNAGL